MAIKIGRVYKVIHCHTNIVYVGSTLDTLKNRWQNHKGCVKAKRDCELSIVPYYRLHGIENFKMILIKEYKLCGDDLKEIKIQLRAWEQLWINKCRFNNGINCVNKKNTIQFEKLNHKKYREKHREEIAEYQKKYHEEHKEEIAEQQKKYREEHKEERAQCHKKYREEHKEELLEYNKKYREENKEKVLERKKQYYEDNKVKLIEQQKQYYKENKEKVLERKKQYHEENKEKINKKQNEKISCDICGTLIGRCRIARHKRTKKCTAHLA